MVAAQDSVSAEVVASLLRAGADPNAGDANGSTALMIAAESNTLPRVLSLLIDAGARVNAQEKNDWTPLMFAVKWNPNPDIARTLIEAGANTKLIARGGVTVWDLAQSNNALMSSDVYERLRELQEE